MRLKILSAVFAIVFIAVLVIGLLNLLKKGAEPVPEAASLPPQVEAQPSTVAFSDLTGELLPGSLQPGITVIRRHREDSTARASINEEVKFPDDLEKSKQGGGSKRKTETAAPATAPVIEAGVTKLGHRPTPEESKEMKEKGIIIF